MPLGSTAYKINENGLNKMMGNRKININKFIMRGKEQKKFSPLFISSFLLTSSSPFLRHIAYASEVKIWH